MGVEIGRADARGCLSAHLKSSSDLDRIDAGRNPRRPQECGRRVPDPAEVDERTTRLEARPCRLLPFRTAAKQTPRREWRVQSWNRPIHPGSCICRGQHAEHALRRVPPSTCPSTTNGAIVFLFFSNRLGCLGSLLVSALVTIVLLLILGVL